MLTTFFNIYLTHSAQATPDLGLNRKFCIRRANDHFFSPDEFGLSDPRDGYVALGPEIRPMLAGRECRFESIIDPYHGARSPAVDTAWSRRRAHASSRAG